MELRTFTSEATAAAAAAERLSTAFTARAGAPILFLSAGGSALALLEYVDDSILASHVTIGVSDERFSIEEEVNNFAQLAATNFYQRAQRRGVLWIDTRLKTGETQAALAERFDSALKTWRAQHSHGAVLITQGIGVDGHTAGIMPFPEHPARFAELFENPQRWAVDYDASAQKNAYPLRVTATLVFLRGQVAQSIAYAVGEEKRNALRAVVAKEGALAHTPARVLREMQHAVLFTTVSGLRVE